MRTSAEAVRTQAESPGSMVGAAAAWAWAAAVESRTRPAAAAGRVRNANERSVDVIEGSPQSRREVADRPGARLRTARVSRRDHSMRLGAVAGGVDCRCR